MIGDAEQYQELTTLYRSYGDGELVELGRGMADLTEMAQEALTSELKRRGLKIVLSAGGKKGEGLMRRIDVSPDPVVMLDAALQEAARTAGLPSFFIFSDTVLRNITLAAPTSLETLRNVRGVAPEKLGVSGPSKRMMACRPSG